MPVEIKELVIRAVVSAEGRKDTPETLAAPDPSGDAPAGAGTLGRSAAQARLTGDLIVRAAVEEVLRILKAAKER